jgi:hypothetical protein
MAGDKQTTECLERIADRLGSIEDRQIDHGKTLAVLDERTQQHEKRMNRAERRSAGVGATAGGILAGAVIGIKMLFSGSE